MKKEVKKIKEVKPKKVKKAIVEKVIEPKEQVITQEQFIINSRCPRA